MKMPLRTPLKSMVAGAFRRIVNVVSRTQLTGVWVLVTSSQRLTAADLHQQFRAISQAAKQKRENDPQT